MEMEMEGFVSSPSDSGLEEKQYNNSPPFPSLLSPSYSSRIHRKTSHSTSKLDSPHGTHSTRSAYYGHSRKITRDIAALDFLQTIPLKAEENIPLSPRNNANPTTDSNNVADMPVNPPSFDDVNTSPESTAGRRLPGYDAEVIGVPSSLRYRFTTKNPVTSAVVRRWESNTNEKGVLDSRLYFSGRRGYPIATISINKYDGNETPRRRQRLPSIPHIEPQDYDWRGKSYFRLLHATWSKCDPDRDRQDDHPVLPPYNPNYLDDPAFRQGRHRHVVRGNKNIGPVVSSILLFVKPHELAEELNQKFREKHTWLTGELSLSKIRNLKRETLDACHQLGMEVATAALACVYFEKLVLNNYVTKANRKLYMSCCFLLAVKFNEPEASDAMKNRVKQVLESIDHTHSLPSREVLTMEFTIYAQLSFNLHVPISEVQPHFTRLLKLIESNPRKYLDEDVFATYSRLVVVEKEKMARNEVETDEMEDEIGEDMLRSDEEVSEEEEDERNVLFQWPRMSLTQWWQNTRHANDNANRNTEK